ncbi:putative RNA-directed DNA polymerase [Tanacetum coccineum]
MMDARKEWIVKENEKASILRQKSRIIKIPRDDATCLEVPFFEKEVWDTVCGCGSDKAPGPDGFNFKYIKRFWDVIKVDVLKAVRWFWETSEFSKGCNASFVTLIPNVGDPMGLSDYRPISLIGSFYKIIAKLLAHRVKKVVATFLKKSKRKGLIFKVDFEKAYDSIEWGYLLEIMKRMGFGDRWCKWVIACLSSSSISILVNGSPTKEFVMERGVRQGDPLSPFLFILAAEGLNALMKEAVNNNIFNGVRVGADGVVVSHLQYADDTIIFREWSRENACILMNILKCFEEVAGLKINLHKSKLYGVGVETNELERMAHFLRCGVGEFPFMYLGLPIEVNMKRMSAWNGVVDRFKSRLSEWKAKAMSFGGRLTLVKAVHGSLPLYYFSMFRVPLSVITALERVQKNFFWGGLGGGNKIAWVKWDRVISSFGDGGLNIGSLKLKNHALLGDVAFRDRFARLYRMESNKEAKVGHKGSWVNGEWEWCWEWSRVPRGRTVRELEELEATLVDALSRWIEQRMGVADVNKTLWNNLVPRKVNVFVWQALNRRLFVRVELDKKGIDLDTLLCLGCDNVVESLNYCLVLCENVINVWDMIFAWWGVGLTDVFTVKELCHTPPRRKREV